METEQLVAGSELTPSEELQSRFPSFELDFSHEQLEHLEECTRGVVFYGGGNPHPPARRDDDGGAGPAQSVEPSVGPLYQRVYNSASVLICCIPVRLMRAMSHCTAALSEDFGASLTAASAPHA